MYLIHCSLGSPESTTQTRLDRFIRFCRVHGRVSLYFTVGRPFLRKIVPCSSRRLEQTAN